MTIIKFTNCSLCDKGKIHSNTDLWVDSDKGVIIAAPSSPVDFEEVDLDGLIVTPGFIDVQINGAYGFDFSRLSSNDPVEKRRYVQDYNDAMRKYLATGVTSICPTLTSSYPDVYKNSLELVTARRCDDQTDSLGAHCEGPFISPDKKGCHPPATLVKAPKNFQSLVDVYGDNFQHMAILTAAPEVEGIMEAIPKLVEHNVTYSIGHTMSNYETSVEAVKQGANMITHMYNAMPQPHHRDPGVFGLIGLPSVATRKPYFGIVADGVHVHPATVNIAYQSAPEKCILVTDAMSLIGMPDGVYRWDDQFIEKEGNRLTLQGTDTIAGSATTLDKCIRNLMKWSGIQLSEAIACATNNPALSIGVQNKKGFLDVGCDADLTIIDANAHVKGVYKLGKPVKTQQLQQQVHAVL